MTVKVMVAPAIAKGDLGKADPGKPAARRTAAKKEAAPRPKRRRSSVYDAEGNEVFITLMCLKCQNIRPLSQFGLRRMADGAIRNQPWCRSCRSAPSASEGVVKPPRAESPPAPESPEAGESPAATPSPSTERPRPRSVAAEVAAALANGRS